MLSLLAQTPSEALSLFETLARYFGVPFALLFCLFLVVHKGWLRLGREYTELLARWAASDAERDKRFAAEQRDKEWWRDTALRALHWGRKAADVMERQVPTPPAEGGHDPSNNPGGGYGGGGGYGS
jgi:hypothetical protein